MNNPLALIIEDDPDLAMIFAGALQEAGYDSEIAHDGRIALEQLANTTPAVVVLDLHLPRVSGKDVLRQMRADPRLAETRVILATADPLMADNLREEADLVLLKPISFDQLSILAARLRPHNTST